MSRAEAVDLFRRHMDEVLGRTGGTPDPALLEGLRQLRGHDLACFCPLDGPCHAEVLLELANSELTGAA